MIGRPRPRNIRAGNASFTLQAQTQILESKPPCYGVTMSLLKYVDRIALASILTVSLGIPAAALACSTDTANPIHVTARRLNDDSFQNINAGMSAAEVLARIGPPDTKMRFERSRTTSWDYRFVHAWSYDAIFSVTLNDRDIVVSKFTERPGQ